MTIIPAFGTPGGNNPDAHRINAEKIHDDARAEARVRIREEVDAASDRIVDWITANTDVKLTKAQVSRMKKELEIGVRPAQA